MNSSKDARALTETRRAPPDARLGVVLSHAAQRAVAATVEGAVEEERGEGEDGEGDEDRSVVGLEGRGLGQAVSVRAGWGEGA